MEPLRLEAVRPRHARLDLPDELRGQGLKKRMFGTIKPLRSVEQQAITQALIECNGNKSKAARRLGISRKALYTRLREPGT